MKIQLDTVAKTIKLDESVNVGEFMETLRRLLPDNLWREFSLETHTIINNWTNPYVVPIFPYYSPGVRGTQPFNTPFSDPYPWYTQTSPTDEIQYSLNQGVFNIEIP